MGRSDSYRDALTVQLPAHRLGFIRLLVSVVVFGPVAGALAAAALALQQGVSARALMAFAIAYVLTMVGITVGFHRHFAHRAFSTSRPVELVLIMLGSAALQGSLLYWVATHRQHHQFSDTPDDPHSPHFRKEERLGPWRGFLHAHVGWLFSDETSNALRFAPDIAKDRFVFEAQRRYGVWVFVSLALPAIIGAALTRDLASTIEIFLWAGPVRILVAHHVTWAVDSFSHMWGGRRYDTGDRSTNNLWVALPSLGEGLQNNHHAFPRSARVGLHWWEPDLGGMLIELMQLLHLVWDVQRPNPQQLARRRPVSDGGVE